MKIKYIKVLCKAIFKSMLELPMMILDWKRNWEDRDQDFFQVKKVKGQEDCMEYDLCYQEEIIGIITYVEKDFPSYTGKLILLPNWEELLDEDARLMMNLGFGNLTEDDLTEEQYESLCDWVLETEDWTVVDNSCSEPKSHMILPPTFRPDYIAWRMFNH